MADGQSDSLKVSKVAASTLKTGDIIRFSEYSYSERKRVEAWLPIERFSSSWTGKTRNAHAFAQGRSWLRSMRAQTVVVVKHPATLVERSVPEERHSWI